MSDNAVNIGQKLAGSITGVEALEQLERFTKNDSRTAFSLTEEDE